MSENFLDQYNKNELIADYTVERKIEYRDVDYFLPRQDARDIRRRLDILRNFSDGDVRVKYWSKLQNVGKDSPACFIEMMRYLGNFEFLFHSAKDEIEWSWIFRKLQVNSRHRIEMLPGNVDLNGLITDLNELRTRVDVLLNIGGNSHLLNNALYSLRGLVWLNVSNSNLSNDKIQSIIQVINRGGLQNLRALVLTGNPVLDMKKLEQDLRRLTKGKLQYLETDCEEGGIEGESNNGDNGGTLERIEVSGEFKLMNDAKKFDYLVRRGIIDGGGGTTGGILVDYIVCNAFEWGHAVKQGLATSCLGRSYRVVMDPVGALTLERAVGEKLSRYMMRKEEGSPVVKRRKRPKTGTGGLPSQSGSNSIWR